MKSEVEEKLNFNIELGRSLFFFIPQSAPARPAAEADQSAWKQRKRSTQKGKVDREKWNSRGKKPFMERASMATHVFSSFSFILFYV